MWKFEDNLVFFLLSRCHLFIILNYLSASSILNTNIIIYSATRKEFAWKWRQMPLCCQKEETSRLYILSNASNNCNLQPLNACTNIAEPEDDERFSHAASFFVYEAFLLSSHPFFISLYSFANVPTSNLSVGKSFSLK